jgi:hypothetical protein
MTFMSFKRPIENDIIWLQLENISSLRECNEQWDRTIVTMNSGVEHEIDGRCEDILKDIVDECSKRHD